MLANLTTVQKWSKELDRLAIRNYSLHAFIDGIVGSALKKDNVAKQQKTDMHGKDVNMELQPVTVNLIRTCDICQRMNRKLTCGVPELHPIPFEIPMIFMRMGLPRVMLSDNGSEFCNKLNDKLAEILGVKRRLTTPYHPQANGLDERYNQTLQNMLAKFVSTKQTVWSSYLDTCTFAYNTSRHESSTYTPFQLMFGRQAILPVDIDLQKESGDELHHKYQMLNDPDIVAVQHKHQVILEDAKKHILDAQRNKSKRELVMKKNFRRKKMKGGKLQDRFDGPHRVVKKMPHGVYELISKDGTLIRATGGHLKMYHSNMLQGSISFDDKHLMTSKPPAK
eukprot:Em0002g645a